MNQVFQLKESNIHCSRFPFKTINAKSVSYSNETLSFMGPKIWALVPNDVKNIRTLPEFKRKIKLWKPDQCPCRICKTYVADMGFIELTGS